MNEEFAVFADGLTRTFEDAAAKKKIYALQNIALRIPKGRMTALIGPDGAGKTTMLRLLCGLLRPDAGFLRVLGLEVKLHAQEIQSRISYMPQKFGLYEDLSVQENLNLYADLHGIAADVRQQRFARLLQMTSLAPFTDRLAGKLSGGMKQKLGLACTLVRSPELLLLDEPTVGVDPLSRRELWQILQELVASEGITVIVSTAYMEEAELCGSVIVLHEGAVLAQGTPQQLRQLAAGRCFRLQPPTRVPTRILQACLLDDGARVLDAVPEGGAVRFIVRDTQALPQLDAYKYFSGLILTQVTPRLEDGFMLLLRERGGDFNNESFPIDYRRGFRAGTDVDIEVRELVKRFGDFIAVNNTSFSVRRGEIFGLLGPNGAGKTTTFRMLCGLLPTTSGFLAVAGMDLRRARNQARANVGYVAQKFSLYGNLTVEENLHFYGGVYGLDDERLQRRLQSVKKQFNLLDVANVPAEQLPGGYKQRLSMAAALLHEPKILFLDEPTSGIDPLTRRLFWRQITALAANGTTIIITTHFMEEAEYCDRIMIQDQGRMLALDTPAAIRCQQGRRLPDMNAAFIAIVEQAHSAAKVTL
jgi:ABC-2 type transport system ATP-binding protein